jgi:hypothetical protein
MIHYTHQRNYGCRLTEVIYCGLRTLIMENELLRVTILVDKGTDIIEFLHKPTDTDYMWRSPLGVRNPATFVPTIPRPEGAFLDYYSGGWQECLPTGGNPSGYAGTRFGPHGEACLIPWGATIVTDTPEVVAVRFEVRTYRTPLYLQKTLTLHRNKAVLHIDEQLVNEGRVPVDVMWGHHPAFGPPFLDASCVIDLPGASVQTTDPEATHRCQVGSDFSWPRVPSRNGGEINLSRVPSADVKAHDLAFLTNLAGNWYAITNQNREVGFGMAWNADVFKALWLWQVYGGAFGQPWYGRTYNIAIEPWTTPHPTIEAAMQHGTSRQLQPAERLSASLCAVAYSGHRHVSKITINGEVTV